MAGGGQILLSFLQLRLGMQQNQTFLKFNGEYDFEYKNDKFLP